MSPPYSKFELRKILRNKNLALSAEQRSIAARAAENLLQLNPLFQASTRIACYLAHGGEFDLHPIIQTIWRTAKQCYLPIIETQEGNVLHFIRYHDGDDLQTNQYNILEPIFNVAEEVSAAELDIVLMPLTGFDKHGYRLGSGGGFYDKTFAFLLGEPRPTQPKLIGVGFSHQEVEAVPHDVWDVRLDGILTEMRLLMFT